MLNFNFASSYRLPSFSLVKQVLAIFSLLLSFGVSLAQVAPSPGRSDSFSVQFPVGSATISPTYSDNASVISELDHFFSTIEASNIDSIIIVGSSSPDGTSTTNSLICTKRAEALSSFIGSRFSVPTRLSHVSINNNSWADLLDLIINDPLFPNKGRCLVVLNGSGSQAERLGLLKTLGYDTSYDYINDVSFPRLRTSSAVIVHSPKNNLPGNSATALVPAITPPQATLQSSATVPVPVLSPSYVPQPSDLRNSSALFTIHYPIGSSLVDADYADNTTAIDTMSRFFSGVDISAIDSIGILGSSSPEENAVQHFATSSLRAEYLKDFMGTQFSLPANLMFLSATVDTWPNFIKLIKSDPNFPDKTVTLAALNSNTQDPAKRLKYLVPETSYNYICDDIFPKLRSSTAFVVYYNPAKALGLSTDGVAGSEGVIPPFGHLPVIAPNSIDGLSGGGSLATSESALPLAKLQKPLLALKTNLLYDAVTVLNFAVEVPIGKHYSVAGEFIFPWWLDYKRQNCLQVYSGNVEGKYWFEPRKEKYTDGEFSSMTGWFAGVYAGIALYDVEYRGKGYQGEFLLSAGIMGGYAHSIGRNLRMEYSLGVGYMQTNYRSYESKISASDNEWYLYRQSSGTFKWVGPTQAKISLVWMLNRNVKL